MKGMDWISSAWPRVSDFRKSVRAPEITTKLYMLEGMCVFVFFFKRNSWLSSVFQRGTVTLNDCSAPHFLPTLITGALWPGPVELLGRGAFIWEVKCSLAWGRKGEGWALPVGLSQRASHQLSGSPLTSQPILNVGFNSSQDGVGHGHLCSSECCRSFYAFRVFPEAFHV